MRPWVSPINWRPNTYQWFNESSNVNPKYIFCYLLFYLFSLLPCKAFIRGSSMFCEISQELNLQHKASDVWLVGAAVANRNFVVAASRLLLSGVCWPDVLGISNPQLYSQTKSAAREDCKKRAGIRPESVNVEKCSKTFKICQPVSQSLYSAAVWDGWRGTWCWRCSPW